MRGGKDQLTLDTLALAYKTTGDIDKATETQRKAISRLAPGESLERTDLETKLASLLREKGDDDDAESMLREVFARVRKTHGEKQAELVRRTTNLALLLSAKGKYLLHDVLCDGELTQLRRGIVPQAEAGIAHSVVVYATALVKQRKYAEAKPYLRECLEIRRLALPEGDWRRQTGGWQVAHVMSLLGAARNGQDKFTEAEPLLLDAYNQMKENAQAIPYQYRDARIREALERIINLYKSWDKPDQAANWRAKLENGD